MAQLENLVSDSDIHALPTLLTFSVEDVLLGGILIEDAGKREAVFFREILWIRNLEYLWFIIAAVV